MCFYLRNQRVIEGNNFRDSQEGSAWLIKFIRTLQKQETENIIECAQMYCEETNNCRDIQ